MTFEQNKANLERLAKTACERSKTWAEDKALPTLKKGWEAYNKADTDADVWFEKKFNNLWDKVFQKKGE